MSSDPANKPGAHASLSAQTAIAADPRVLIDNGAMSRFQWGIVAVMVGLNALDGFDVLSISFASPGIATEWGIDRAALGLVLSMELIGMSLGSIVLGRLADRIGRRITILGCLLVMSAGMFGAATSSGVEILAGWRVFTGLGIGGMLAATNAAVAEASNRANRSLTVVLMAAGYPVGTVLGGTVASSLLALFDWRSVFVLGGVISLVFVPIVLRFAPESIHFLIHRGKPDALTRVNEILARMGHRALAALPTREPGEGAQPVTALFSGAMLRPTLVLTVAYFAQIMTFYFILKWIPKIVADFGYPAALAGSVLVWASLGGLLGSLVLGLMTRGAQVRWLTIASMVLSFVFVMLFGQGAHDLGSLSIYAAIAGFATNAGVVGLYALLATTFPTSLRASATGLVIGVGRGGSALAPALAGFLFEAGYGLSSVALLMGLGSILAAAALLLLPPRTRGQS
jgi:benzoate transport